MARVVINATNLHVGGGVQVATSFIGEIPSLLDSYYWRDQLQIFVSTEVAHNLSTIGFDSEALPHFEIQDTFGGHSIRKINRNRFQDADVVFTVFGPDYDVSRRATRITGFAQPWIAYPNNEAYRMLSVVDRNLTKLKFLIQWYFFKSSDVLVVEADHIRNALEKRTGHPDIEVVHNPLSSIYFNKEKWGDLEMELNPDCVNLGLASRPYLHKNLNILPEVRRLLRDDYGIKVDFWVTYSEREWANAPQDFREEIRNVGELSVNQCPTFYNRLDGVIFPSLLEASSLTPLEALVMRKPLFASDRAFVRNLTRDFGFYFDPLSSKSIAGAIASYFSAKSQVGDFEAGYHLAVNYGTAVDRARKYLNIIDEFASNAH